MPNLVDRLSLRRIAALAAYAGLGCLVPGVFLPALTIGRFGDEVGYSIVDTAVVMANTGSYAIATIIVVFSILFPIFKLLVALLVAMAPPSAPESAGYRLVDFCYRFGKHSMLDVFVIAVFIVVYKVQDVFTARVEWGLYFFMAGIVFSVVSGGALDFDSRRRAALGGSGGANTDDGEGETAAPADRRAMTGYRWLLPGALALLVAGLAGAYLSPHGSVESILVKKAPGVDLKIISLPDAPDYALEVRFKTGDAYRTETKEDTPIGNGILFEMPLIALDDIAEISIWEDNSISVSNAKISVIPDQIVDRVMVANTRALKGQKIEFELNGSHSLQRLLSYAAIVVAALMIVIVGALFVWQRTHRATT
ncbi:MAG: paraquat-inducible protein A [Alphaproteobacteria bacterium]|jgi:hypothetical protein|nr:paraquat-inducible protein A [Alphaproteobacteria bacterium]